MGKRGKSSSGDHISVGDISHGTGIAIGRGAQATVTQGLSSEDLSELFATIYREIERRPTDPDVDKEEITEAVQRIEKEAAKGQDANPSKIERWLHSLARMAPDILDVTAACLSSPAVGIATTIRKIAQKAKEEASRA